jgi:hypothetical protein
MRSKILLVMFVLVALIVTGGYIFSTFMGDKASAHAQETAGGKNKRLSECAVTRPPQPAFIPPDPWPSRPPDAGQFWYGEGGLWTALPEEGSWRQLAFGEKFWWWSAEFDASLEPAPDLTLTAQRLDGDAPFFQISDATHGFHKSFYMAMLIGVELPSPGCWEITGQYHGHELTFVLWVPKN